MRKFTAYLIYFLVLCTPVALHGASTCIDCGGGSATLPGNSQVCSPGESPTTGQVLKYDGVCWDAANDATGAGGGVEGGDLDNGEFCIWNGSGSVLDCNVPLASIANLNTLLSANLVDTGTLTDGRLCTWDNTGTEIDCDTATTTFATNSFTTMNAPSGTDPQADSTADTLNLTVNSPGIAISGDSSTDTLQWQIVYTNTLGGNPTLGQNACVFSNEGNGGGFLCEGSGNDNTETLFLFPDLTSSDTTRSIMTGGSLDNGELCTWNSTTSALDCNVPTSTFEAAGSFSGIGSCTNQVVTALNDGAAPTCTTLSDAYLPDSITANITGDLTGNADTATALAANPTDCSSNQFANAIAASGNLTCAAITDADVPNNITIDLAAAATALAANPTDCSSNQFANAIAANGNLTCAALLDADVPDTITASNYLPLAGGTMTGQIISDNLGIEFEESDTNPTCSTNNYNIYADASETAMKVCNNGTAEQIVTPNNTATLTNKTITSAANTLTVDWSDLTNVPAFRKTLFQLRPQANEPPASNFATMFTRNSHPGLSFDGDVCAMWSFVMPNWYGGNGVTVDLWIVSSETTNDTDWDGSWERIATTQDIDSDSFATAVSADNNNNNATSGIPTKVSIAFTDGAQMDSCAADELCRFRVCRDATSDTGGTTNGQAVMIGGQIRETP